MKPGRNDPCPCGSGKKYKRCCMDSVSKQHVELSDSIAQTVAMNPNLTIEELNLVMQHRVEEQNNRPVADFCGLSPTQMGNWLEAPFGEADRVTISTPQDLAGSPVMRYLALIMDEAIQQDGSFKTTSKGNVPVKLVKKASELLPEFAVAQFETDLSISDFAGNNEDNFRALRYTRILAELAGILDHKSGRIHIKKDAQNQYQNYGLQVFFLPMLQAAVTQYNWCYFDFLPEVDLQPFWLFLLWRLQNHGSIDQLTEEVCIAFPDLLRELSAQEYSSVKDQMAMMIDARFVEHFLQYWGFVIIDPKRFVDGKRRPRLASIQPLLTQTFRFLPTKQR